jgi:hypothetical protein
VDGNPVGVVVGAVVGLTLGVLDGSAVGGISAKTHTPVANTQLSLVEDSSSSHSASLVQLIAGK